jgi:4-amino-4-deoxy-L-arabinose transferase-like glycosyltransferase
MSSNRMDTRISPPHISSPHSRRLSIVLLIGLMVLIGLERLHTYNEPLERDIAGYAVIGHEMLKGRELYSDLWERKPPLMYIVFAAAEIVTGYGKQEIFLLNVLAAWMTLLGIYVAGRGAVRVDDKIDRSWGGLIAAVLWTILGTDLYSQANQPNGEVFINACLTWAFALLLIWPQGRFRHRTSAAIGGLFAAATLFKHHTIIVCAAMLLGHLLTIFRLDRSMRRAELFRRLLDCIIAVSLILAAWGVTFGYFAAHGRLSAMMDVLFRENADYAGDVWSNLFNFNEGIAFAGSAVWWMVGPIGMIAAWLLLAAGRTTVPARMVEAWICWALWAAGTWCAIAIPGYFLPHYYQLAMPPVVVAAAWCGAMLLGTRPGIRRTMGRVGVFAALLFALLQQARFYRLTPAQWSDEKNVGPFSEQYQLADWLNIELKADERFWEYGHDNTLYFATRRSPPTGLLYSTPLLRGSNTGRYWDRLLSDLQQARPDLVLLISHEPGATRFETPVLPWLRQNYLDVGINSEFPDYVLLLRNDSDLRKRLPTTGFKPDSSIAQHFPI